jgi:hypothetical protein
MTTEAVPALPDRSEVRALYDAAVSEINASRNNDLLTTGFYAKIGDAVFNAGLLAIGDAATNTRRMHTVAAPAGSGKTSFSYALIAAVTRYADTNARRPYGSALVVDQIEKADQVYRDLSRLLPGKVALYTSDHDRAKPPKKIALPAAKFTPQELPYFPVIVVTHAFYLDSPRGHYARTYTHNGTSGARSLTLVDERPNEAPTVDIILSEAEAVREALRESHPQAREQMDLLLKFMQDYSYARPNKLYRPGIELDHDDLSRRLGWFRTLEAERVVNDASSESTKKLFAFANALLIGRGCVATSSALPHFFAYEEQRITDLTAGTVLLDATADIDGVSNIVPWRTEIETPKARYDNLEIIHVPQHTKTRLNQYFKDASNQHAYVDWMIKTIMGHMEPDQKGLVVCKVDLIKNQRVPNWPERDSRFKEPKIYTEDYGWELDGRRLCVTHWGTGIGSNTWKDADVVFLFEEFFVPRRIHMPQRKATGAILSMRAIWAPCGRSTAKPKGWTTSLTVTLSGGTNKWPYVDVRASMTRTVSAVSNA